MSNAVSALNGVSFTGIAKIEEAGLQGMITLRGDFASQGFKDALKKLTGRVAPKIRETYAAKGRRVLWMSPDELMILTDYASVQDDLATLTDALNGEHALAVNVSDARALFRITGESAREVIGKLAPVDMGAFEVGDVRRTRLAQVAAAFWLTEAGDFELVCFRSVAQYVFDLLSVAAQEGSEVGVY
jgi:sarcosine oxidase subunit gamma